MRNIGHDLWNQYHQLLFVIREQCFDTIIKTNLIALISFHIIFRPIHLLSNINLAHAWCVKHPIEKVSCSIMRSISDEKASVTKQKKVLCHWHQIQGSSKWAGMSEAVTIFYCRLWMCLVFIYLRSLGWTSDINNNNRNKHLCSSCARLESRFLTAAKD